MNVLFIGDIFGKAGRKIIRNKLPALIKEFKIECTIANGENVAGGKGITRRTANQLIRAGVDIFTSGNHLWDRRESLDFIKQSEIILKPANFPEQAYGKDWILYTTKKNNNIAVINFTGQAFMHSAHSPYSVLDKYLPLINKKTKNIIIDFHAEATAEKRAFGFYCNGKVSAVLGTHTHIQTADEEILSNGTGYITDVGMTGPHDSVIGIKKKIILKKVTTGMPERYEPSKKGLQLNAVLLNIDNDGKTKEIKRIKRKYDDENFKS